MIKMINSKTVSRTDASMLLIAFFTGTFIYFWLIGNYVLYFQETQSLFLFSEDYLNRFLKKPGGIIEYSAKFLTQFYAFRFTGSLILSLILTLPGIIIYFINKQLIPGISFSILLLLIPSSLMLLMQANYYHLMEYNLGFILILACYLFLVSSRKQYRHILVLAFFPLVYFIAGAYALIFGIMYLIHILFIEKAVFKYLFSAILLIIAALSFLISWKFLFLQPVQQFVLSPLPLLESQTYRTTFIILTGYIVVYPLICSYSLRSKERKFNTRLYSLLSVGIVFIASLLLLFRIYNPQTARVVELERLVFNEKWGEAIRVQEKKPARNLISQYFYNIALSETGQLCDRLFLGSQDFGTGCLVLPWGDDHLDRGAWFYYSIGLINEAHRWAYEEMVVYGYRPQNIIMLAKTSLISGNFREAGKYIDILKKTVYYRELASKFERMAGNPELIKSDPELGEKIKLLPKDDFFIKFNEPQANLPLVLEGNPGNRKAFEYYVAGLLLTKNVELVVNNIKNLQGMGYTKIPRHIEEAAMVYYNSTKIVPDLGGLTISTETQARFDHYFVSFIEARKNQSTAKATMEKGFGDTFWYYFHFK